MISVIVPYKDAETFLGRALESLHTQEGDFEFVLVDDGSKDCGPSLVEEYVKKDSRFMTYENTSKPGVSGARNTGIKCAKGEWITFMDADDEMLPGAYMTYCAVIDADPDAQIHQLNHMRYYTKIDKLALKYTNEPGKYQFGHLPDMWFGIWNKLFKAELLKGVKFNEKLQYGEDGLFALEALLKAGYIHHGTLSQTAIKHRFDNTQSLSKIKTSSDVQNQIKEYEKIFAKQKDPVVKSDLAKIISDMWGHRLVTSIEEESNV